MSWRILSGIAAVTLSIGAGASIGLAIEHWPDQAAQLECVSVLVLLIGAINCIRAVVWP
jgi:hypothetical protein